MVSGPQITVQLPRNSNSSEARANPSLAFGGSSSLAVVHRNVGASSERLPAQNLTMDIAWSRDQRGRINAIDPPRAVCRDHLRRYPNGWPGPLRVASGTWKPLSYSFSLREF